MRKFYLVLLFAFMSQFVNAQWPVQNPKPGGGLFRNIFAFDVNTAIALSSGIVVKTTDGGTTWSAINPEGIPANTLFVGISFAPGTNTGWLCGSNGKLFKTTDKGTIWAAQVSGLAQPVNDVYAISSTVAFFVTQGGVIKKTTDGGTNWVAVTAPALGYNSVAFNQDGLHGIAIANSGSNVAITADGGTTWVTSAIGSSTSLNDITYIGATNIALVVGLAGKIFRTVNNGSSWTAMVSGTPDDFYSIASDAATGLWASTNTGKIRKSADVGVSWTNIITYPSNFSVIAGISFAPDGGWAAGGQSLITKTIDGGVTWTVKTNDYSPVDNLLATNFFSTTKGVAVGTNGRIRFTNDGGNNWANITSPTVDHLNGTDYASGNDVWAVGNNGTINYSPNGGVSGWVVQGGGVTIQPLNAVSFADPNVGCAVGAGGTIIRTTNKGVSWSVVTSPVTETLNSISFANNLNGWAVGNAGTIIFTTNGGATWSVQPGGTVEDLYSVSFAPNTTTGYASGANGTIRKTTNGTTWSSVNDPAHLSSVFVGISCMNSQSAIAVANGILISTVDGGTTWKTHLADFYANFLGTSYVDATNAWVVGNGGIILKNDVAQSLPITLTSFTASTHEKAVSLQWETSSEQDNKGFEILRNSGNDKWETIGFVRSKGNSSTLQTYNFEDQPTGGNTFLYQLRQIDVNGKSSYTNVLQVKLELSKLELTNYPNPFKEQTTINYSLPVAENVSVVVRDQYGNLLKTISKAKQAAGNYAISFYRGSLPAGQYYCELSAGSSKRSIKLSIIK